MILLGIGYYAHDIIETPIIKNVCEYSPQQIKNQKLIIEEQKTIETNQDVIIRQNEEILRRKK
jgi:hypothetical protein